MHVDQVALTAMSLSPKKTTLEVGGSGCIPSNSDIGQSAGLSERDAEVWLHRDQKSASSRKGEIRKWERDSIPKRRNIIAEAHAGGRGRGRGPEHTVEASAWFRILNLE